LKKGEIKNMAKVNGPLMSMTASGKFGDSIVYDRRGIARKYVIPSNPQTDNQMLVRNKLGDIQRSLKLLGVVLRTELKAGFGPRWNSDIVGELTKNDAAALTAYIAEYDAFDAGQKTAWDTADTSAPVELDGGAVLYACASAVYDMALRLDVTVTLTQPAAANAATVGAEWIANS
jgi:hypothetical protein